MKLSNIKIKSIKDIIRKKKGIVETNKKLENTDDYVQPDNMEMDEWREPQVQSLPAKRNKFVNFIIKYSLLVYVVVACTINFLIETMSRHSFLEALEYMFQSKNVFLYNSYLIFVTLTFIYLVRKRIFAFIVIGGTWLLGGIINGVILFFRVTPLTGTDLNLIKSGVAVGMKYLTIDQIILASILTIIVICLLIFAGIRTPKYKGKMRYPRYIALSALLLISILPITKICVKARILSTYFGNIVNAYEDYGFPYCFGCSVILKGIDCPDNYGEAGVKKIINRNGKDSYNTSNTPNIIIVQLESFFDPILIKGLRLSKDPIPNFRYLKNNFSSGYINVPVVGAGTVNTEFEVLTGMSLRSFGPGEYPYKTILTEDICESVAYNLKDIGYSTHVVHNNVATFYGRMSIFPVLGFDTFTSEEMMNITDYTPLGWPKDAVLKDSIMECLNSTPNNDFVYTITVQSHGGYPSNHMLQSDITVGGTESEEKRNSMEYYVAQVNEVDQFIGDLVEELSNYHEDTVLVLFGDHQPSLGQEDKNLVNGSIYQTEYVIWDNFGLKTSDKNLKSYQLSASVLDMLDIHVGTLMKYHQERMKTKFYYSDLEVLQYDMLYGNKYVYGGINPYEEVDMQMGIKDIAITSVTASFQEGITITGENFNKYSRVKVNDKEADVLFIDQNTLRIEGSNINIGDTYKVSQISEEKDILSSSALYIVEN